MREIIQQLINSALDNQSRACCSEEDAYWDGQVDALTSLLERLEEEETNETKTD